MTQTTTKLSMVGEIIASFKTLRKEIEMDRTSVSSSNLAAIGYDENTEILEVEFLNGSVYEYRNVPLVIYQELMAAPSHGSFFNREIRLSFPYEKIG